MFLMNNNSVSVTSVGDVNKNSAIHYITVFFMDINTTKRVTLAPFDVLLLDPTRSVSVFRLPQVLECCRHITLFIMQNGRVVTIGGSEGVLFPSQ